jgi:hypothetical protein
MRYGRNIVVSILRAIWLPAVAYFGAGLVMILLSGHTYVTEQVRERAAPEHRTSLNMRLEGYDTADAARLWGLFDPRAQESERRFLLLDLLFPLFYGGAFLAALLRVWRDLGRPFSSLLLIAPVAITVVTDWIENLIHLAQLRRYVEQGEEGLQSGWIQVASAATTIKISLFAGTLLFLVGLAVWRGVRQSRAATS